MATIRVNGQSFSVSGNNLNNIQISNGTIMIGGNIITSDLSGDVHIHWDGPLANLTCDGSVTCQDIQGSAQAGGSISCNNAGSVNAGGSVRASGNVGPINAGGSVRIN